jgi:hypothetical protein
MRFNVLTCFRKVHMVVDARNPLDRNEVMMLFMGRWNVPRHFDPVCPFHVVYRTDAFTIRCDNVHMRLDLRSINQEGSLLRLDALITTLDSSVGSGAVLLHDTA